jgi:hypothetical protein
MAYPERQPSAAVENWESIPPGRRAPLSSRARLFWLLSTTGWAAALTLGLLVLIWQVVLVSQSHSDFCQDYIASMRLLQGQPPYQPLHLWPGFRACTMPIDYDIHPPFLMLFFAPLALLPKVPAFLVWGFLSLAAYLASGVLLLRELGWYSLRGVALFVAGSLLWEPLIEAEGIQNLGQVLLLLLVVAWLLERKGRAGWAGTLLGLATLMKLWPAAFLLGAVGRKQWRLAVFGGLTILGGVALTFIAPGPGTYLLYLGPIQSAALTSVPNETNISLVGLLTRPWTGFRDPLWSPAFVFPPLARGLNLTQSVHLGEAVAGLLLVGVIVLIAWCMRRAPTEPVALLGEGLLVIALLLVFPYGWYAGLITLLLPGTTLILALRQLPKLSRWWWALLGVAVVPLIRPEITVALYPHWMPALQRAGLAGWGTVLVDIPTFALLLLTGVYASLLWWASKQPVALAQKVQVAG